VMSRMSQSL